MITSFEVGLEGFGFAGGHGVQVFGTACDHEIDQIPALDTMVESVLLDVGEGFDYIVGIHLLRRQVAGATDGGVG